MVDQILDEKEKKIFICYGYEVNYIKNALNSAIIPISFINYLIGLEHISQGQLFYKNIDISQQFLDRHFF